MTGQHRVKRSVRRLALSAAAGIALLSSACSSGPDTIDTRLVTLQAEPGLNNDFPLAVDLVLVLNETLMGRLDQTSAEDWFTRRTQFERDYPTGMKVVGWEMVPGAPTLDLTIDKLLPEAIGAFVFARYRADGDHRGRIDRLKHAIVRFGPKGFEVLTAPPGQG